MLTGDSGCFMQQVGCLIGKRTQRRLVKLLIYTLEWHKGKEMLCFPLIYLWRVQSTVKHDRMRPNNRKLSVCLNLTSIKDVIFHTYCTSYIHCSW